VGEPAKMQIRKAAEGRVPAAAWPRQAQAR